MSAVQENILVVDDNEMNRDLLQRRLERQGYRVALAADGEEALQQVRREPCHLMLLDLMMPRLDGHQVLARMKADKSLRDIPVIVITAMNDIDSAAACIEEGAEDYLLKPFNPVLLKARVTACLEKKRLHDLEKAYRLQLEDSKQQLEERVRVQVERISSGQLATIFAMSKLAESRDPETGTHLERMREYCRAIAGAISRHEKFREVVDDSFVRTLYAASPLHDIGKVGVPDSILLKQGPLEPEEWAIMTTHSTIGAETLRAVNREHPGNDLIEMGIAIAESHHEKWDGSGYPHGLSETDIPLAARILALGDVYDALTSRRCYKPAFSHQKSREIVIAGSGGHFDPDIVEAFLAVEEEFVRIRSEYRDPEE